jgi:cytochrome c-type biogenesis protein CcmF
VIAETGHYALVLALGLALIQSVIPMIGARLRDPVLMNVARSTALAQLVFALASFALLVTLHVTSDFSVANVYENSHSMKPLIYKITGVWGNHEGSMLLWVSILALFGGLVAAFGNNLPLSLRARVLSVQAWIASAFYLFILVTSNPCIRRCFISAMSASRSRSRLRWRRCSRAASTPPGRAGCDRGP